MKIDRNVTTVIDADLCTGCGLCVSVCPEETITIVDGKARVTGTESLNCGHCEAVCPENAVTVEGLDAAMSTFKTFGVETGWLPHGAADTGALVTLMRSRRSCRNFKEKPVSRDILEDLVKIGITAPSGSNCQKWAFTLLSERASVDALGRKTANFYGRLNRMAKIAWLRSLMKMLGQPELDDYYHAYYQSVTDGLHKWDTMDIDPLFHGAPAAMIVGAKNTASCPVEDTLLATQNILLGAHSMGLGTCLIGFVIEAMKRDKRIHRFLRLPQDETPYAVIAIGYPAEIYQQVTGRKEAEIRYFS